jgi:hypothetical protein
VSLLGAQPNRSELIELVSWFGWVPLGRNEKRVKANLIRKLETAKHSILPFLDSRHGAWALEKVCNDIIARRRRITREECPPPAPLPHIARLPPEATVEFYLNRPVVAPERAVTPE